MLYMCMGKTQAHVSSYFNLAISIADVFCVVTATEC